MPQITITIDIDDEIGDVSIQIEEVQAHGITISRDRTSTP